VLEWNRTGAADRGGETDRRHSPTGRRRRRRRSVDYMTEGGMRRCEEGDVNGICTGGSSQGRGLPSRLKYQQAVTLGGGRGLCGGRGLIAATTHTPRRAVRRLPSTATTFMTPNDFRSCRYLLSSSF